MQDSWQVEQAQWHEYKRGCKAARTAHKPLPPSPNRDPAGWQQWQYTRRYLKAAGHG